MTALSTKSRLSEFIYDKLNELDAQIKPTGSQKDEFDAEEMNRLKVATKRTAYSKILSNFLNDDSELATSHFEQAKIYLESGKLEQAIVQGQIAKKKVQKRLQVPNTDDSEHVLAEDIELLLIEANLKNKKCEDALALMEQMEYQKLSAKNTEKFFKVQAQIFQALKDQLKSEQSLKRLHEIVTNGYGSGSTEEGLCLIQMGKNHGCFEKYELAIELINKGMEILISNRHSNPLYICKVYQTLSTYNLKIQDYEKEYSALICALSMIKQVEKGQESLKVSKETVHILTRLASNLEKRDQKLKALEQLYKVEAIQRKVGGQSSVGLAKTVKKIIALLGETGRLNDARKYQVEYEHLIGSRVALNAKSRVDSQNRSHQKQFKTQQINSFSRVTNH